MVDDLKVAGEGDRAAQFIKKFNEKFELGIIWSRPGRMRFFGINLDQAEYITIRTNSDDKLNGIVEHHITQALCKEFNSVLIAIEKSSFTSMKSSLGWIGTASSTLCSFYASHV